MAKNTKTSAESTPIEYADRQKALEFAKKIAETYKLRDVTKSSAKTVQSIDKTSLKQYFQNVGSNENNFRKVSKYLYYRSNIYNRMVSFYANMFDFRCRKVTPQYDLSKTPNAQKIMKNYNKTLDLLDKINLPGNMYSVLVNVFVYDVCYAIVVKGDNGYFFYILDPDDCVIDGRYSTGDFSFSMDMSKWKTVQRQAAMEGIGEPLTSMYAEYQRTSQRMVHCPDEYAFCIKFHSDTWDMCVPPFLGLFLQFSSTEDLADLQAIADELDVYKLLYMPLDVLDGTKQPDDFKISPDLAKYYFNMLDAVLPQGIAAAMVPGEELKVIDFNKSADSEVNALEKAHASLLQTSPAGAVLDSHRLTTNQGLTAFLKNESATAINPIMPQVDAFVNRMLSYELSKNACKVEHFRVSIYTKEEFAKSLLDSATYSYANRIAYNTLLGVSEKETLAMLYFENEALGLPTKMVYPLMSSHTASGEVGQGAPEKDETELTDSGDRDRNRA